MWLEFYIYLMSTVERVFIWLRAIYLFCELSTSCPSLISLQSLSLPRNYIPNYKWEWWAFCLGNKLKILFLVYRSALLMVGVKSLKSVSHAEVFRFLGNQTYWAFLLWLLHLEVLDLYYPKATHFLLVLFKNFYLFGPFGSLWSERWTQFCFSNGGPVISVPRI